MGSSLAPTRPTMRTMRTLTALCGLFLGTATGFAASGRSAQVPLRRAALSLGLFDQFKKAFDNQDYSNSPATYEQTNARASHILVPTEEQANDIKAKLESGELDFA